IELVIDENTFALSMARSVESLPLSTRAVVVPHGLIDAMKSGHMILIQGSRLQSPYNQILLDNSRMNIERVEAACATPLQGAARLWRRIARSIGVCVLLNYLRIARPAVGSGGPGLATSTTGQSGAENTFALSVARLVESLPLSTPPGRNVAHFTRPDHRSGFRPVGPEKMKGPGGRLFAPEPRCPQS